MTIQDIKKALEICDDIDRPCGDCPYDDVTNCCDKLKTDALNLIIEQEKEIERLKAEFKQLETNAEILAWGVRDLNHENYELTKKVKQSQIDILNKVKKRIYDISPYNPFVTKDNVKCFVDELIKGVEK